MKEFMMIFRNEKKENGEVPSPELMQTMMQQWQSWINGIADAGKYSSTNRLVSEGKTIRPGKVVTDGPYVEAKEMVGGYLVVKANTLDEAVEMAKSCPGLQYGGNVEVRTVLPMGPDSKSTSSSAKAAHA